MFHLLKYFAFCMILSVGFNPLVSNAGTTRINLCNMTMTGLGVTNTFYSFCSTPRMYYEQRGNHIDLSYFKDSTRSKSMLCGPTSVAMALQTILIDVSESELKNVSVVKSNFIEDFKSATPALGQKIEKTADYFGANFTPEGGTNYSGIRQYRDLYSEINLATRTTLSSSDGPITGWNLKARVDARDIGILHISWYSVSYNFWTRQNTWTRKGGHFVVVNGYYVNQAGYPVIRYYDPIGYVTAGGIPYAEVKYDQILLNTINGNVPNGSNTRLLGACKTLPDLSQLCAVVEVYFGIDTN